MKLPLKEKLAYGVGDTASNLIFTTVMSFLLFYYTDIFGLTAAAAGALFLGVRVTDAFVDVFVGVAADRTQTRWGKFRPWLLWMAGPFAVVAVLTFTTPDWSYPAKLIYAWVTYLLLMFVYSAINIPYGALSAVMTDDVHERTSLSGVRMSFAQIGALIVAAGTLPLIGYFSGAGGDRALGYQRTMLLFAAVALILFLVTFLGTRERVHPPEGQHSDLRTDISMLFRNRPWMVLAAASAFLFVFYSIRLGVVIYYFKYYLGEESAASVFFTVSSLSAIPGALLSAPLSRRLGKRTTFQLGSLGAAVFNAVIFFISPGHPILLQAANVLGSISIFIMAPLIFSMLADTADYADWKFRRRSTGIVFSASAFAGKVGMGLGGALTGMLLTAVGYVPGAEQAETTVRGIVLMISVLPGAGFVLLSLFMCLYSLDEKMSAEMHSELAARRVKPVAVHV